MANKTPLLINMLVKGVSGFLLMGLLLFGSAGSMGYTHAWILISSLFVLMMSMGIILIVKYPQTLEKRLKSRESQSEQRGYIVFMAVLFFASFILAGLDFRFGWTDVPFWASVVALVIMFVGYCLFGAVILQNSYASRVVEVQEGQSVISTGTYALIRHPLYLAALLIFLSMPFILGSYISLIPMLFFPITLVLRIRNEESVLIAGLEGYSEYIKKTKYRLIPYIW